MRPDLPSCCTLEEACFDFESMLLQWKPLKNLKLLAVRDILQKQNYSLFSFLLRF